MSLYAAACLLLLRCCLNPRLTDDPSHACLHCPQTAIKVVKRQDAAKAAAAASPAPAAPAEEAGTTPTRRLEFGQARRVGVFLF